MAATTITRTTSGSLKIAVTGQNPDYYRNSRNLKIYAGTQNVHLDYNFGKDVRVAILATDIVSIGGVAGPYTPAAAADAIEALGTF